MARNNARSISFCLWYLSQLQIGLKLCLLRDVWKSTAVGLARKFHLHLALRQAVPQKSFVRKDLSWMFMHSIKDQLNTSRKSKREDFADYNRLMSTSIGSGKSASVSDSWLCNNQLMALLMILSDFLRVAFQRLFNIQGVLSPVKMNMCM